MTQPQEEITRLLNAWANGSRTAADELFPLIQQQLHTIAEDHMRGRPGHILQTTALVNEAYLKLAGNKVKGWKDRGHFFAVASTAMRHVLIDYARKNLRDKRGAGKPPLPMDEVATFPIEQSSWLVALDDALRALAKLDPRAAQIVELRYFGGLSVNETAKIVGLSPATVHKDWNTARLWLMREISGGSNE